jgi:site-specific DNA-methyltransferase (adenine-specific)
MINITNECNLELMARYEDNYFDLAIVDPPYEVVNDSKATGFKNDTFKNVRKAKEWDFKPPSEYWKELFRVSKNQIIWGFQYFIDELPPTKSIIIWDKMNGANFMNDAELAWNSGKGNNKIFKHAYIGRYHPEPIKIHPTQKPVKLYEWLLQNYAQRKCVHKHSESERYLCSDCRNSDVKILDTHLGSGSIAIACHNMKFDLTACELDTEYYNSALKRLKQHTNQQRLF